MSVKRTLYLVAAVLAIVVVAVVALVMVNDDDEPDGVRVTDLASLKQQDVVYVPGLKVFVIANDPTPIAVSAIDPHLRHRDLYCRSSQMFEGRHGEKFDRFGFYFGGPAPRGLDRVAVEVHGDDVYVNPDEQMEGPPRGAGNPEPRGRFCSEDASEGPPGFVGTTD